MRRRPAATALACLAFTFGLTGCKDVVAPEESLSAARVLWLQVAPSRYTITMHISCECPAEMMGPVVMKVRDGVVEFRRYVSTGGLVPAQYASRFLTIEELFNLAENQLRKDSPFVNVLYDRDMGYPIRIEFPGQAQQDVYSVSVVKD